MSSVLPMPRSRTKWVTSPPVTVRVDGNRALAVPKEAPRPAAAPRVTPLPQTLDLTRALQILAVAAALLCISMVYVSYYVGIAQEGILRAHLIGQLRAEKEKTKLYEAMEAQVSNPASVEQRARALQMISADAIPPVRLGGR